MGEIEERMQAEIEAEEQAGIGRVSCFFCWYRD